MCDRCVCQNRKDATTSERMWKKFIAFFLIENLPRSWFTRANKWLINIIIRLHKRKLLTTSIVLSLPLFILLPACSTTSLVFHMSISILLEERVQMCKYHHMRKVIYRNSKRRSVSGGIKEDKTRRKSHHIIVKRWARREKWIASYFAFTLKLRFLLLWRSLSRRNKSRKKILFLWWARGGWWAA